MKVNIFDSVNRLLGYVDLDTYKIYTNDGIFIQEINPNTTFKEVKDILLIEVTKCS